MYGSIHDHFESIADTGNDLNTMISEFEKAGAKRVAVTEHGEFTSFEDILALTNKKDKEGNRKHTLEVVPGIEGYLSDKRQHIILIAKDKEGYNELSNIISDSSMNHDFLGRSIITMDILKKHVRPSHIIFSSACVQGVFGEIFVDQEKENERNRKKYTDRLDKIPEEDKEKAEEYFDKWKVMPLSDKKALKEDKEAYEVWDRYLSIHRSVSNLTTRLNKIEDHLNPIMSEEEKDEKAYSLYKELVSVFGEDDVYLEIQNHFIDKEQEVYGALIRFARNHDLTSHLIASNDIHVGKVREDLTDDDLYRRQVAKFTRFKTAEPIEDWERELYIKDDDELKDALMSLPYITEEEADIAIHNIEGCLSKCDTEYLYNPVNEKHYPKFSDNEDELFDRLVDEGIKEKFPNGFPSEEYQKRVDYEKSIIHKMGYSGYHLIVQDYIDYGRNLGYLDDDEIDSAPFDLDKLKDIVRSRPHDAFPIGAGRGSAVGSLCCYLLGITDIDPIPYGLLFERFLNPERVSMPDIDTDFSPKIRNKCIDYCTKKYGHTAKIVTKQYTKIRGSIDLAARFMGNSLIEEERKTGHVMKPEEERAFMKPYLDMRDKLSDMIVKEVVRDENGEATDTTENVISENDYLRLNSTERKIYDDALKLKGLCAGYGQHACGNIISGDYLPDIVPLKYNKSNDTYEITCPMGIAEEKGLLKMDFLGLENLDILTDLIHETGDDSILDYTKRDALLSDKKVFRDIFDKGLTQGVFQFESDGMKKMMRDFSPDTFEDLILLNAAYRPGPLQFLPEIIKEKQYRDGKADTKPDHSINIDNEKLKGILSPTYGCIIYQEQVMKICTDLAGFTLGHADNVRKAMGKKQKDKLKAEREGFVKGCKEVSQIPESESNKLFDQMTKFAEYAFNKSHATAYTLLAYFTAYYKAYYPQRFYSVSLNHMKELKELNPFRNEMGAFGITLSPPRLGKSQAFFASDQDKVYFSISGIKGVKKDMVLNDATTIEGVFLKNKHLATYKPFLTLAYAGVFDKFGDRSDIVGYITEYHDKILKQRKALDDIEYAESEECTFDAKKKASFLRGANKRLDSVKDIPSFEEYAAMHLNKAPISDDELKAKEYGLLKTVFLSKKEERYLKLFDSLDTLKDSPEKRGFYLYNSTKVTFKNKKTAYKALVMDSEYNSVPMFFSKPHENGIYQGFISDNPFSSLREDEKGNIKRVKGDLIRLHPYREINVASGYLGNEVYKYIKDNIELAKKGDGYPIEITCPSSKKATVCPMYIRHEEDLGKIDDFLKTLDKEDVRNVAYER